MPGEPASVGEPSVDSLTAVLRAQSEDMSLYAGFLFNVLVDALPADLLQVTRRKSLRQRFGGGEPPVVEIGITLGDRRYTLHRDGVGAPPHASVRHAVGGVVLSSAEVPLDRWAQELAAALVDKAGQNGAVRAAMQRMLDPGGGLV